MPNPSLRSEQQFALNVIGLVAFSVARHTETAANTSGLDT
jgi:hypothetical protein